MTTLEYSYLLQQYEQKLKLYALKLTTNLDDAQDLVQETMLKALRYRSKFSEGTNFGAWMHTIMKNTFINQYRRKQKRLVMTDATENQMYLNNSRYVSDYPSDHLTLHKEIKQTVEQLDHKYKEPFQLHFAGYKYQEIAEQLHLPVGTVKSRIFTARSLLSAQLSAYVL
ncbi:MAG: polymerase subunit sigma [Chitinophagaceae bacterium]|nr:polymerase subunit sigma [Chitinophagaceae bacterium]